MEKILELQNVYKIYDLGKIKLEVLKGISFVINKGDFIVVLGPSGSGKSTLLNVMSCLDVPTSGRVLLEGADVSTLGEDELAKIRGRTIGFVFQQFNLLHHLKALENVALPAVFQGVAFEERTKKAKEKLEAVGLSHRLDHKPGELSGGEKQRVAIARALINNPHAIVADEPTGNVDSKTGEKIMSILQKLNEEEGRTIIVVTHDSELADFADRIIRIKDGEIHK